MEAKVAGKEAFIPFGEGIHFCLGSLFALDSVQAVVAAILQRWRLAGTGGDGPVAVTGASLGIKGGLTMIVEPAPNKKP
jgi:cytochrome P450